MNGNGNPHRSDRNRRRSGMVCACGRPVTRGTPGRHADGSPACQLAPWELMVMLAPQGRQS
jgi:hypothetical protein